MNQLDSAFNRATPLLSAAATDTVPKPTGVPAREDIDAGCRWDLSDLYGDTDLWAEDLDRVGNLLTRLHSFRGKLDSAAKLLEIMRCRDEASVLLEKLYAFAMLRHHEDTDADQPQADYERARSLINRFGEETSWIEPALMALDGTTVSNWIEGTPELQVYRHWWADLSRQRAHVLSEAEERILALSQPVAAGPNQTYSLFTNADLKFPTIADESGHDVELTQGRYGAAIYSHDRRYRKDAFTKLHDTYDHYANTFASLLGTQIKRDHFFAKARGYDGCLHAALAPYNIPVAVYEQLLETVGRHLPLLHRYAELRKRVLGVDELRAYDLYVSLAPADKDDVPYDDAVQTIFEALDVLGPEYMGPMKQGFSSRWIDVYETRNKRSGAYSMGTYAVHPYLLLNYNNTANARSTVAHEMGHAMHTWFTQHSQPPIYGDYTIFCAEVASTVNEVLLNNHLLARATDDTQRLRLINAELENIRTTVFRQTMFAEFEKTTHEMAERHDPLTATAFYKVYRELYERYYGPTLVIDECLDAECLRIPHFYRSFYVYQYATSYCAATNIARRILDGDKNAVPGLLRFLKAGSSDYSIEILKMAGVDLTEPTPFKDTMKLFETRLGEMEKLLG
jgi:oligoendopeptidase F